MQKLLIISLIGWMAVAMVSAEPSSLSSNEDKPAKIEERKIFRDLDAHLREVMPYNNDPWSDLEYLRANISQLSATVKEAAQMVIYLKDIAKQAYPSRPPCSDKIMSISLEAKKSGLAYYGEARTERLLGREWEEALDECKIYIKNIYKDSPANKVSFFEAFKAHDPKARNHQLRENLEWADFYNSLKQMAGKDPKAQFHTELYIEVSDKNFVRRKVKNTGGKKVKNIVPMVGKNIVRKDRQMFDYAFDEYFVKTCKSINSNDEVLESLGALTLADFKTYKDREYEIFWVNTEKLMYDMNWARSVCDRILNMNEDDKTRVYNSV